MTDYKYISENTIEHLSLHDCDCTAMKLDGEELVFELEWIEVLATHPDNPFPQAHQSGKGRIVLHGAVIEHGVLIKGDDDKTTITDISQVKGFEVLSFDEERTDGGFELSVLGIFSGFRGAEYADYIEMKIRYSSSTVMFSELGEVSWFETFKQKEERK